MTEQEISSDNVVKKTVYFLGAGASRADFPDIPLMDNLLHEIVRTRPVSALLMDFLEGVFGPGILDAPPDPERIPRIDDLFTLIDASLSGRGPSPAGISREKLIEVRRHLTASIGLVVARAVGAGLGRTAIRFAKALPEASTLISTNYDIVMDSALLERRPRNVNYGVAVREAVQRLDGQRRGRFEEMHHFRALPDSEAIVRTGGIPLLKLNGSLNWLYCPRCDELDITLSQSTGAVLILDEPELGRCSQERCTSPYETVLVGPSLEQRYENRFLAATWVRAERSLREAASLVIVGYSLPEADYLVRAMFARTFGHRSDKVTVVTITRNPFEQSLLESRYRRLLAHCRFDTGGFADYVERLVKAA
ncbi:MAG TPA: hypothetical protein VFW45_04985 [Candidatus Polarisedimenticolia bacterium]|nr:hypothetical protein [Candidatus Polarisedimenticolia bacterium]